jgi:signal transduction histidine kinase
MAPVEHEPLPATLLAREPIDPLGQLREDLEDALKEYRQFDLLVEVLQNAIDAIEARRWESLCAAACEDEAARRAAWWNALAAPFHDLGATISADDLAAVSNAFRGTLRVRVEVGDPNWLTVEDDGVGIADIAAAFTTRALRSDRQPRGPGATAFAVATAGG